MRRLLTGLVAALLGTTSHGIVAAAGDGAATGRVIVKLRADSAVLREHVMSRVQTAQTVATLAQRRADTLAGRIGSGLRSGRMVGDRAQVLIAAGLDSATLASRLSRLPDVEYAVVDRRRRATAVPNDPLYAAGPASGRGPDVGQWYLRAAAGAVQSSVNAEAAWNLVTSDPALVVAVLDTGVLADHLDLAGRVLAGHDMVSDANMANDGDGRDSDASDPGDWITSREDSTRGGPFADCGTSDSSWHGTMVSGIIGAASNNGLGIAGLASGVRLLPVRVLGKCGGFDSDIAAGLYWAAGIDQPGLAGSRTPARVLNLSLGGDGACSPTYRDAIAAVGAAPYNALVIAAAGNSTGLAVGTPANCPGVVAVAGLRHAGSKVGFSDLGPEVTIAAPGGNCINTAAGSPCLYPIVTSSNTGTRGPDAGGSSWTDGLNPSVGTSFSAPIVSGIVALMLSARPELTPTELIAALRSSARPFPTSGADNGSDPTPVPACRAPDGVEQLQCYCNTSVCGAGMVDAFGAVAAVIRTRARISVLTAEPKAGDTIELDGSGSLTRAGHSITVYRWELVDGGGASTGLASADNAPTARLSTSAAGTLVARLTVTDDGGETASTEISLQVAAAAVTEIPPTDTASAGATGSSGSGGGAMSWPWLALLTAAAATLLRCRHRTTPLHDKEST